MLQDEADSIAPVSSTHEVRSGNMLRHATCQSSVKFYFTSQSGSHSGAERLNPELQSATALKLDEHVEMSSAKSADAWKQLFFLLCTDMVT